MFFAQSLVALVALTSISSAAPTTSSTGFTLKQEDSGRGRLRSGPLAVLRAHRKFGVEPPENVKLAAAEAKTGSQLTQPTKNDASFLCPVQIGTPAQTLMLDFDTGSSDLWVFSSQLASSRRVGHSIYTPTSSSSARELTGQTWEIRYGDGSRAAGNVWTDKVVIGGITATSQAVEAATAISAEFQQERDLDGLVGLAGPRINQVSPTKQATFFENIKSGLQSPLFAAYLKHDAPGAYDFGYLNPAHYTGAVHYTPVDSSRGYYEITTTGFSAGFEAYSNAKLTSVVDTGTSLMFMPVEVIDAYYSQVRSAEYSSEIGGVVFACDETPPDFAINVGGSMRTVPGSYLNYAPVADGLCFGGLQPSAGMPVNILGDVFLKSQYVVFDNGNRRLGFADQK